MFWLQTITVWKDEVNPYRLYDLFFFLSTSSPSLKSRNSSDTGFPPTSPFSWPIQGLGLCCNVENVMKEFLTRRGLKKQLMFHNQHEHLSLKRKTTLLKAFYSCFPQTSVQQEASTKPTGNLTAASSPYLSSKAAASYLECWRKKIPISIKRPLVYWCQTRPAENQDTILHHSKREKLYFNWAVGLLGWKQVE